MKILPENYFKEAADHVGKYRFKQTQFSTTFLC